MAKPERKKIKKTRVVVGIICIVLAAVIAFIGLPIAVRVTTQTVPVLCATRNIDRGERISSDNCEVIMMGQENLPDTVYNSLPLSEIPVYAKMEIAANSMIMVNNTTKEKTQLESLTNLPDGKVAVSFTFGDTAASFDNQFQAGDIVEFLVYNSSNSVEAIASGSSVLGQGIVTENALLKYVKLYSVNNEYGTEIANADKAEVKYTHATVIVTPEQAKEIIRLEKEGGVHLSLIYRYDGGEENLTDHYIKMQDEYIEKMNASNAAN